MTDKPDEAKMREILAEEYDRADLHEQARWVQEGENLTVIGKVILPAMQRAYELGRAETEARMSSQVTEDMVECLMDSFAELGEGWPPKDLARAALKAALATRS